MDGETPRRITIKTGISDDEETEVVSADLREGMDVILEKSGGAEKSGQCG